MGLCPKHYGRHCIFVRRKKKTIFWLNLPSCLPLPYITVESLFLYSTPWCLARGPFKDAVDSRAPEVVQAVPMAKQPQLLRGHVPPARRVPKTLIMPDYIS